jgi:hypothetical protein
MPLDPKQTVRSSNQLWGDQVGIIDAIDAMDSAGPGEDGLQLLVDKRRYPIYPFNRNGRQPFVAPLNPYA